MRSLYLIAGIFCAIFTEKVDDNDEDEANKK